MYAFSDFSLFFNFSMSNCIIVKVRLFGIFIVVVDEYLLGRNYLEPNRYHVVIELPPLIVNVAHSVRFTMMYRYFAEMRRCGQVVTENETVAEGDE